MADGSAPPALGAKRFGAKLRAATRVVHRDLGYVAVGLTVVYAVSGLALNHVGDFDANFTSYARTVELGGPVPGDDAQAARTVLDRLGVKAPMRDAYRAAPDALEITLDKRTLHVDTRTGRVLDEGQEPRFFLRAANWLHENRGKKAWTRFADVYAAGLLLLSLTGVFMLPGKKGLVGRGGALVLLGALVPILYVTLSGGP